MNTPHKWALELRAMADGQKIQERVVGDAIWRSSSHCDFGNPGFEFRVAPLTQILRYRVAYVSGRYGLTTQTVEDKVTADSWERDKDFGGWLGDWQEVEVAT